MITACGVRYGFMPSASIPTRAYSLIGLGGSGCLVVVRLLGQLLDLVLARAVDADELLGLRVVRLSSS